MDEESQMVQNLNEIESSIIADPNDRLISQLVNDVTQIPSTNDKLISQMINVISDVPESTNIQSDKLISQMINDIPDTPIRDISNKDDNESEKQKSKKADMEQNFTTRPCQLALSRIKTIMKLDPELNLASKDSVFIIGKATVKKTKVFENFINKFFLIKGAFY